MPRLTNKPRKRKDGRYEVRLSIPENGRRVRISIYGNTAQEAERLAREVKTKAERGQFSRDRTTVTGFVKAWLERRTQEVRPRTAEAYRYELGLVLPSLKDPQAPDPLGARPLKDVTPAHIRELLDDLGKRCSIRTVRQARARLHSIFEEALSLELIHRNPVAPVKIKAPREAKAKAGRALELHEVQALLTALDAHSDPRTALSLRLMLACGLRLGEALGLQWQDVDLEAGVLKVSRAYSAGRITGPKTHTSARTVPIPRATLERLRAYRDWWREKLGAYPPQGMWVFAGNNLDKPLEYRAPAHLLTRVAKKLGIPHVRVHDLRHSYGSHLLANGAPLELVSERMGHANPNITLGVYRHLLQHERQGFVIDPEDLLQPRAQA
ncbi:tyrosine-type recombinase/integrase [Meiothermus sp. CFH 77666]|uniref:tyrosine-type recombinase/integrase n=1 Tax=Meiothermus sp. CFH 77666 TaxID=2817942 RepID=UPI001AA0A449|nr:tyrosine-type recombinase/integrase [Meiothermus sp. CFH 77666]MBO1436076.1 site-specific integrase [Meiothermus sp. CFH 77666]